MYRWKETAGLSEMTLKFDLELNMSLFFNRAELTLEFAECFMESILYVVHMLRAACLSKDVLLDNGAIFGLVIPRAFRKGICPPSGIGRMMLQSYS